MICALIAPPSVLGKVLEACVAAALKAAHGEYRYVFADPLDGLPPEIVQAPTQPALIVANAPGGGVARDLAAFGVPALVLLDDAAESVRFVRGSAQTGLIHHVRTVSHCLALTHDIAAAQAEIVLDRRIAGLTVSHLIESIGVFYKLPLDAGQCEAIAAKLASELEPGQAPTVGALCERRSAGAGGPLSPLDAQVVQASLGPFCAVTAGKPVRRLVWPGALFCPEDGADGYTKTVDLTGRARIVIYGPALRLPRGRWIASPTFSVANNHSGNILVVDVFNGETLAEARFPLPAQGKFSCSLDFENAGPARTLEVRFAIGQGAIEGVLEVDSVAIEQAPASTSPLPMGEEPYNARAVSLQRPLYGTSHV